MKSVLVLGAGKSATILVDYLLQKAGDNEWTIIVGDISRELAEQKIQDHPYGRAIHFDVFNDELRLQQVRGADLVISLLPASMHPIVAADCVREGKNMLTASYVSDDIRALHEDAEKNGVILLNEMGVDPGLDHMSAMRVLDRLRSDGFVIKDFETFTGGLVAPDSEGDNPWRYKFSWNPRNVVLSGQGVVKFLQEYKYKYIPYHRLFRRTEVINIPGYGEFEGYPNRDSLKYRDAYNLHNAKTIFRGTLRRPGFSRCWNAFVQLGATDDTYVMENSENLTNREFINSFLFYHPYDSVELKLAHYMNWDHDSSEMYRLHWLGIFDDKPIGIKNATPAQIMEHILGQKWLMKPEDRDMVVMYHKFIYQQDNQDQQLNAYMVTEGENRDKTAMAKTVGLPLGIAAKLILQGQIDKSGVQIPTSPDIYEPVLQELEAHNIIFQEEKSEVKKWGI